CSAQQRLLRLLRGLNRTQFPRAGFTFGQLLAKQQRDQVGVRQERVGCQRQTETVWRRRRARHAYGDVVALTGHAGPGLEVDVEKGLDSRRVRELDRARSQRVAVAAEEDLGAIQRTASPRR